MASVGRRRPRRKAVGRISETFFSYLEAPRRSLQGPRADKEARARDVTILRRQGGGVRDAMAKDGARSEQRATEEENEQKKMRSPGDSSVSFFRRENKKGGEKLLPAASKFPSSCLSPLHLSLFSSLPLPTPLRSVRAMDLQTEATIFIDVSLRTRRRKGKGMKSFFFFPPSSCSPPTTPPPDPKKKRKKKLLSLVLFLSPPP